MNDQLLARVLRVLAHATQIAHHTISLHKAQNNRPSQQALAPIDWQDAVLLHDDIAALIVDLINDHPI